MFKHQFYQKVFNKITITKPQKIPILLSHSISGKILFRSNIKSKFSMFIVYIYFDWRKFDRTNFKVVVSRSLLIFLFRNSFSNLILRFAKVHSHLGLWSNCRPNEEKGNTIIVNHHHARKRDNFDPIWHMKLIWQSSYVQQTKNMLIIFLLRTFDDKEYAFIII